MGISPELRQRLDDTVKKSRVVLFMKGSRRFPQCGFSASVVSILDQLGSAYETVNVLADPELREGLKEYSEWPTFPQLYVDGKLVGGADIVREMAAAGELGPLLPKAEPKARANTTPPAIRVTEAAAKAFHEVGAEPGDVLRLEIGEDFRPDLFFGPEQAGDVVSPAAGLRIHMDEETASRAGGMTIDYVSGPGGAGFKIDNPNEPARVRQIGPEELHAMLQAGEVHLFDVRTQAERDIARIEGAIWLDDAGKQRLEALPKEARVVFHCKAGGRSQAAAEHYLSRGWKNVMNLRGGILAWSARVDPKVPTY